MMKYDFEEFFFRNYEKSFCLIRYRGPNFQNRWYVLDV